MSLELEAASHSQSQTFENVSLSCVVIKSTSSAELSSFQLSLLLLKNVDCQKHSLGLTIALSIAYLFIFVFGLIGNSLVIFVVSWRPRMRSVTNIFILNLAVADLFVIVFCVPPTLLANIYFPWVLGEFMCKAVTYIQGVSVFSSVYSLVAVSLDRCQAIHRPMGYPRGLTKSQCVLIILLIWLVALLTTLPWLFTFQITLFPETGLLPHCFETWNNRFHEKIYYIVVHVLICYVVPLILIIICNSIIWRSVVDRQNPQNHITTANNTNIHQMHRVTRLRVFKMLASLTLAFFLCWLPLYVIMTRIKFFGDLNEAPEWEQELIQILIPISQLLGSCNSCVNPVLYAWLNKKFRQTLKSLLPSFPCSCCWKRAAFSSSMAEGTAEQNMDLSLSVLNSRYNNTAVLNVPTVSTRNSSPNSLYGITNVTTL